MTEPAGTIRIDLYCLSCGYNLRGLSGDPVRCPECGNLNPIGDVEIPAKYIKEQLERLESAPAYCVASMMFGLPTQFGFWALVIGSFRGANGPVDVWIVLSALAFGAVALWIACLLRFRNSCMRRAGWGNALVLYHLVGLIGIPTTIGSMGAVLYLAFQAFERGGLLIGIITCAAGLAAAAGALLLFCGLYRWLKAILEPLQRDVAVEIARRKTRERLVQRHGGMFQAR